jgi:hypothetical protein
VKVTEGPEYNITSTQDKVNFVKAGSYAVVGNLPATWHNADKTCTLVCQSKQEFALSFDEIEVAGSNYVSIQSKMQVEHTINGYTIPVVVTTVAPGDTVSCGVNW